MTNRERLKKCNVEMNRRGERGKENGEKERERKRRGREKKEGGE